LVIPEIFYVIPSDFSCHSRESGNPESKKSSGSPIENFGDDKILGSLINTFEDDTPPRHPEGAYLHFAPEGSHHFDSAIVFTESKYE
jgi:hypothetical protein